MALSNIKNMLVTKQMVNYIICIIIFILLIYMIKYIRLLPLRQATFSDFIVPIQKPSPLLRGQGMDSGNKDNLGNSKNLVIRVK